MRVLVFGVSGMLGSAAFRLLHGSDGIEVYGTLRSAGAGRHFSPDLRERLLAGIDADNLDGWAGVLRDVRPHAVINAVGIVKQLESAKDPLVALPVNALFPHRLARLCDLVGARLVHVSTDCVFSGRKGRYTEADFPDADDLYGRSKLLGEVDYANAITLRTSIIGRELASAHGLVDWFLAAGPTVKGFTNAIFSGLTTDELARVIRDRVLPRSDLRGVYHVASEPIDKYSLLTLVKEAYGTATEIVPDDGVRIDRSLDPSRFRAATGYRPPAWPDLIGQMRAFDHEERRRGLQHV